MKSETIAKMRPASETGMKPMSVLTLNSEMQPMSHATPSVSKNSEIKKLSDSQLTESLRLASVRERDAIASVALHIYEFMSRRLYLEYGCTSIFQYLTERLGYAKATAQNRIDAARLLEASPSLEEDLSSGAINLTQISVLAQGLRQLAKENPTMRPSAEEKEMILEKIKNRDVETSAVIVARELNLNLKEPEKTRHQKDESVVLQVTLTKVQFEMLRRAKDISSHVQHDANWADVIALMTTEYLKRKDLTLQKFTATKPLKQFSMNGAPSASRSSSDPNSNKHLIAKNPKRHALSMATKREVAQRGWQCEARDPKTGERCRSTYQLQFDHVLPVHAGGGDEPENLQLLGAIHNRWKFQICR